MFDKIVFISDHGATIKLKDGENITMNLMNLHLVFEDETKKVLGEVNDINGDTVSASFLGEIVGDRFLGGTIRKPRLDAKIRVINKDEILLITGKDEAGYMALGTTPFYEGMPVYLDVNNFFSGHFAIMGNSGSGKSCGISRLFQNMFNDKRLNPCNANIIMIDSSGEYYNAFSNLNMISANYHYRFITTNEKDSSSDKLRIPIYLLNEDDLTLLLQATSHSQLPIIERMRKLALVFSQKDMNANNYKNHLIAKAIMTILYTNETAPNKRNEVFSVLASCSTPQFNLEAVVQGIGYTRKFRECFLIDNSGNFSESVLLTEYVSSFIDDKLDAYEPKDGVFYTLDTLEKALNFTLISEGWLRNRNTYGDAVTLKVRLHSLIISDMAKFFDVSEYMTVDKFLNGLVNSNGVKYQFVNINLDDVDDDFAKVITKIISRLVFDFSKGLIERASIPFHIVIEEAHRYIQNDNDRFLIGYNIFERIAKEGRKYGVILGIITQRPVELSDTVISQCSNFLIFKMNHPVDVEYIRKMVPNISDEIVEKQKTLQSGTCLGFGGAFKIPMIVRMEMPSPAPWSGNCDVVSFWGGGSATSGMMAPPTASAMSQPIYGGDMQGVASSPIPVVAEAPSEMNKEIKRDSLVVMNVEDDAVPEMHAGEFGLVTLDTADEVKIPTTDTGVNLVSLSGVGSATNEVSNMGLSIPNVSSGDGASLLTGAATVELNTDTGVPLVNFVSENAKTEMSGNDLVLFGNPVSSSFDADTGSNVVGINSVPTIPSLVNSSGNATSNNAPVSNVTAAPEVNIMGGFTSSNHSEEEVVTGGVDFVNTPEPSGLSSSQGNIPAIPNLVSLDTSSLSGEPQKSSEELAKQSKLNDTFGKPDLMDFNTGGQMMNGTSFNPISDVDDKGKGNDGFSFPSGMTMESSNSEDEPLQFNAGTSLVSFLDQM